MIGLHQVGGMTESQLEQQKRLNKLFSSITEHEVHSIIVDFANKDTLLARDMLGKTKRQMEIEDAFCNYHWERILDMALLDKAGPNVTVLNA